MDHLGGHEVLDRPISRRRLIGYGLGLLGSAMVPGVAMAGLRVVSKRARLLAFDNLHTGEKLKTVYFENGRYVPGALSEIDYILRDFRSGDVKEIDPKLLDLLFSLKNKLGSSHPYEVISGYRSPQTNAMLHANSEGVAVHSMHLEGKAIDICMQGRSLSLIHRAALRLQGGGVGYYPRSGFVHVDTGRVRYW